MGRRSWFAGSIASGTSSIAGKPSAASRAGGEAVRTLHAAVAVGGVLVSAAAAFAVFGPGPNSVTVPSTGQVLSATITAPANNSQVPIPPGTVLVQGNCAITPPQTSCNQ